MKLTVIQKSILNKDYESFLKNISPDRDIVCFGELAVSGCFYNGGEAVPTEDIISKIETYSHAVLLGFPRKENDLMYNSVLYYANGEYQLYNKINLFEPMNEPNVFQAGNKPVIFETKYGKAGALICYDLRFPELFSELATMGAKYIFVPAAWPRVRVGVWRELLQERAKENSVYIIGINSVGDDGTNEFGGSSMVVAPDGTVIAEADETTPQILEVEI